MLHLVFLLAILASDKAIAIACFLPLTTGPFLDPERNVPLLNSPITLATLAFFAAFFTWLRYLQPLLRLPCKLGHQLLENLFVGHHMLRIRNHS
jgi:hypothetical protein